MTQLFRFWTPRGARSGGVYDSTEEPHPVVGPESCDGGPLGVWIDLMIQRQAIYALAEGWLP